MTGTGRGRGVLRPPTWLHRHELRAGVIAVMCGRELADFS